MNHIYCYYSSKKCMLHHLGNYNTHYFMCLCNYFGMFHIFNSFMNIYHNFNYIKNIDHQKSYHINNHINNIKFHFHYNYNNFIFDNFHILLIQLMSKDKYIQSIKVVHLNQMYSFLIYNCFSIKCIYLQILYNYLCILCITMFDYYLHKIYSFKYHYKANK